MNQRAAFKEIVLLAEVKGMPDLPGTAFGLAHLRDMESRITDDFSEAKLGRWLGWAQACLCMANVGVTLDDVKHLNMRHSEDRA